MRAAAAEAGMRGRVAHERRVRASTPIVVRLEDLLPEPPPETQPSSRMPVSAIARPTARTAPGAERPRQPRTEAVDAPAAAAAWAGVRRAGEIHGKRASSAVKTEELHKVRNMPPGAFALDFQ